MKFYFLICVLMFNLPIQAAYRSSKNPPFIYKCAPIPDSSVQFIKIDLSAPKLWWMEMNGQPVEFERVRRIYPLAAQNGVSIETTLCLDWCQDVTYQLVFTNSDQTEATLTTYLYSFKPITCLAGG